MNDLQVAKAIAGLEGVELMHPMNSKEVWLDVNSKEVWLDVTSTLNISEYNPITDLALNCMLRDKWEVEVSYSTFPCGRVLIECSWGNEIVHFESKEDIPRAFVSVIKLIAK